MKFDLLNKKKKQEEPSVFKDVDKKFMCDNVMKLIMEDMHWQFYDHVNIIQQDDSKVDIELDVCDKRQKIIVIGNNSNLTKYHVEINEPFLLEDYNEFAYNQYGIKVIVTKENGHYIDYVIKLAKHYKEGDYQFYVDHIEQITNVYNIKDITVSIHDRYINYRVCRNSKELMISTCNTNWRLDAILATLEDFDLISVYNVIKSLDKKLVCNLKVKITDNSINSCEELVIDNGKLTSYNKRLYDNETLVNLDYQNGKLVKETKLVAEDIDNFKNNDEEISKAIVKVKSFK